MGITPSSVFCDPILRVVMNFPDVQSLSDICAELPGEQDNLHMFVETFTVVVRDGLLDRTI